ncbi:histidinol-phosphate aminotransferase family protein [Candidatus Microgenomates bacterium]|nr:MAG: histidinol-phosphate aminotransferase family protein [Candidatus Microgenomates bacterium]
MKLSTIALKWQRSKINTYVKGSRNFDGFLRLDIGEPWFPLSERLQQTIKSWSVADFKKRPDIHCARLKKAAANFWKVSVDNIAVANGSDQFIWLLPRIFMNPRDIAVVMNPTFFLFAESVIRAGGRVLSFATPSENKFEVSDQLITDVINSVRKNNAKIIWLCNPNNPTGTVISLNNIKRIVVETNALVIVDEAFFDISTIPPHESAISLLNTNSNVVVLKTLSKTFGLSNVRVGFALSNKALISTLNDWRLPFEVSHIAQEIATEILDDKTHWKKMKTFVLREKNWLIKQIKTIKHIELASPSTTTILLLRHNNKNLHNLLIKENILTANFNHCNGIENQRFVRITIQKRSENEKLVDALKKL